LTAVAARAVTGVVVLGMHRSGTSAATRAINLLGVPLCRDEDLWKHHRGNPTGYWESRSLSRFNERLLLAVDAAWWCPPRLGEIDGIAIDDALRREAQQLFDSLYDTPSWIWKDPRTCVTLPFWRGLLDATLCCVLVVRHPLEVAASLEARDGISTPWALALWERYVHLALCASEGLPLMVTDYAELVDDPAGWSDAIAGYLGDHGIVAHPALDELESFVTPELRHTTYGDGDLFANPHVTKEQRALHFALRALMGTWDAFELPLLPPESPTADRLFAALRQTLPLDRLPTAAVVEEVLHRAESEITMTTVDVAPSTNGRLLPDWRAWVAENLLLQVPREEIVRTLVESGTGEATAAAEVDSVLGDPVWPAGDHAAQRLRKLESLLEMHGRLDALDGRAYTLDRMHSLSRRDFLERYYARNRPVLITGLSDDWPARRDWTPERLKERLGHVEVEVQIGREQDDQYELHSDLLKTQMSFGEYIDRIERGGPGNDLYLTANNHFFERDETACLLDDFTMPTEYLDPNGAPGTYFLWLGPAGTITPLHHDVVNVFFMQVVGRKRLVLIPALETPLMYNDVGVFSAVDLLRPDFDRHPRFAETTRIEVVVEPGESLFIPVGWWHHVEALDASVSLSFTNFVFPNNFRWEHPHIDR
jgi:Cupin-like domain